MPATAAALQIKDRAECSISIGVLALTSALPIAEIAGREFFGRGVPGSIAMVQHLTLWITFLGAALAARSGRLLTMATPALLPERVRPWAHIVTSGLAAGIVLSLLLASFDIIRVDRESGGTVAWGIPVWAAVAIMPAGFVLIAARLVWNAAPSWTGRGVAALGLALPEILINGACGPKEVVEQPGIGGNLECLDGRAPLLQELFKILLVDNVLFRVAASGRHNHNVFADRRLRTAL